MSLHGILQMQALLRTFRVKPMAVGVGFSLGDPQCHHF